MENFQQASLTNLNFTRNQATTYGRPLQQQTAHGGAVYVKSVGSGGLQLLSSTFHQQSVSSRSATGAIGTLFLTGLSSAVQALVRSCMFTSNMATVRTSQKYVQRRASHDRGLEEISLSSGTF